MTLKGPHPMILMMIMIMRLMLLAMMKKISYMVILLEVKMMN